MLRRAPSIAEDNAVQQRLCRSGETQRRLSQQAREPPLPAMSPGPASLTAPSRRSLLRFTAACTCAALFPTPPVGAQAQPLATGATMLTRAIPQSQEALPVVGFGTWQTFDIGTDAQEFERRKEVLAVLFGAGGKLIDSSPMYGSAEAVVGRLLREMQAHDKAFLATKVWTRGQASGVNQMQASLANLQTRSIDLMQIHNLVDWKTHLRTLRAWKEQKRFRYIGITHYTVPELDSLADIIRDERLDFVQFGYSLNVRAAETRLLPLAAERGVAVIANQPFDSGSLFAKVRGKSLPSWASEFDCASWGQFFLKYILSHAAVTCVIPGTAKPEHARDNVAAGFGRLPEAAERQRMRTYWDAGPA
jgi:aryl-alcohol dehydrogenase-like predicted oxidoreductase